MRYATLFDRPTPLEGGREALKNWLAMFGETFTEGLEAGRREQFLRRVEERAAAELLRDGIWVVDYCRLRVMAVNTSE